MKIYETRTAPNPRRVRIFLAEKGIEMELFRGSLGFLDTLEERLAASVYVAEQSFSIADITLLCALDFARVVKIRPSEQHVNIARWYADVSARPSAKA